MHVFLSWGLAEAAQGMAVGGNQMHLAPEVLNRFHQLSRTAGGGGTISYKAQGVWAVGVVAYEMAMGRGPWPDYPSDCGGSGNIACVAAAQVAAAACAGSVPLAWRSRAPRVSCMAWVPQIQHCGLARSG